MHLKSWLCSAMIFVSSSLWAKGSIYELTYQDVTGSPQELGSLKGKVLLVVNTASRCGYTQQYEGLQKLYRQYKDKGLVVLGFPSTSFKQELKSDKEVADFCKLTYKVDFPLARRSEVVGKDIHPVFKFLTSSGPKETQGEVSWNFEKFLVDKQGQVKARFASDVEPEAPELVKSLTALLGP